MNEIKKIVITDRQKELLRKAASFIAEKNMTVPVIFFLESSQSLNYIGSQIMAYLAPFLTAFVSEDKYNDIQKVLEQRSGIDFFLTVLEDEEFKQQEERREEKILIKKMKKMKKIAKQEKKALLKKKAKENTNKNTL